MRKGKKILSLILSVMMTLTAFPLSFGAYAVETVPAADDNVIQNNDFEYKLAEDQQTLCITKYNGENEIVSIPTQIDGKTVSTISDETFKDNEIIKEVYIPETITSVEVECYYYDEYGNDFNKPQIVRRSIIGASPFINCKNLEKVEVSPENEYFSSIDGVFFTKVEYCQSKFWDDKHYDKLVLLYYPNAKKDTEYTVPDNVRYIGSRIDWVDWSTAHNPTNAFGECPNLKKVYIFDNVRGIIDGEFNKENVTICSYEYTMACAYADYYGFSFEELEDPNTETDVEYLNNPDFDFEVTMDDELMITKYKGTDTVVKIPEWVGDRPVTEISNRAFADSAVKEVYLPRFLEYTQYLNTAVDNVDTDIDELFNNFSSKESKCRSTKAASGGFSSVTISSPGASPFANCPDLEYIEVDPLNKKYRSIDGVLFTRARFARYDTEDENLLALVQYPQARKNKDYTIPENIVFIGTGLDDISLLEDPYREFAFYDCPYLRTVNIPDEVIFIRDGEFGKCPDLTICANADSYAADYADNNDINCIINDIEPVLLGDVTGDDNITVKDTLTIMRHIVGAATLKDKLLSFADVNKDNKISTVDAFIIQRYVIGIDMGYDIGKPLE